MSHKKSKDEFFDAPSNVRKDKAVLDKTNSTYGDLADIDGNQPYYYYQGVGSLTGGSIQGNVTHNGIQVTYNGETVIKTS